MNNTKYTPRISASLENNLMDNHALADNVQAEDIYFTISVYFFMRVQR